MLCEGRPFIIGGAARTAELAPRGDWHEAVHPDVTRLDATTRRALADAWAADARHEHASIASFARFVLELLSIGRLAAGELGAVIARGFAEVVQPCATGLMGGSDAGPSRCPCRLVELTPDGRRRHGPGQDALDQLSKAEARIRELEQALKNRSDL